MSRMISVLLILVLGILTAPCTGMSWTKISNRWCRSGAIFPNLEAAQGACLKLGSSACPGVYNERCDGGKSYLCRTSPLVVSNSGSCLYQPATALSTSFQPTTTTQLARAVRTYLGSHPSGNCNDDRTNTRMDVSIQYCGGWGYGKRSQQLKENLEEAFEGQLSVREIRDPGTTGNFEVIINGDLIWSKKTIEHHGFPITKAQVETIYDAIRARQQVRLAPTTTFAKMLKPKPGEMGVSIQYCGGWGQEYGENFHWLKVMLKEAFNGDILIREIRDPGTTGNFEVSVNDVLVWSKKTWGQDFPTTEEDVQDICDDIGVITDFKDGNE